MHSTWCGQPCGYPCPHPNPHTSTEDTQQSQRASAGEGAAYLTRTSSISPHSAAGCAACPGRTLGRISHIFGRFCAIFARFTSIFCLIVLQVKNLVIKGSRQPSGDLSLDTTIYSIETLISSSIHLISQVNQRREGLKDLADLEDLARKN